MAIRHVGGGAVLDDFLPLADTTWPAGREAGDLDAHEGLRRGRQGARRHWQR